MKNLLILAMFILATLYWLVSYIPTSAVSEQANSNNQTIVSTTEISIKQFNVKDLAHILNVDYSRIGELKDESVSDNFDITVSLISIHISGVIAKVRLKIINEKNESKIINAEVSDSFYSLELTKIYPTYIELKNDKNKHVLYMYKPQVISVITTKGIEEVLNDK